jgi:hypothetical protein
LSSCAKHKEYFDYKCKLLESLGFKKNKVRELHPVLNDKEYLGYIVDFTHPIFEWFYRKYYKDGKRHVNPSLIRHIDSFGLAIWFMDDGSINSKSGNLNLHTNAFTYEENLLLQKWFKKKFDLDVNIQKEKHKYFKLYFPYGSASRLAKMILPYVPSCMGYKLRWTLQRMKSL